MFKLLLFAPQAFLVCSSSVDEDRVVFTGVSSVSLMQNKGNLLSDSYEFQCFMWNFVHRL